MNTLLTNPTDQINHPLQGWMKTITHGDDHAGFNATLLLLENPQTLLLVWRSALTHAARVGSEIKLLVSHDEGSSFEGLRSIYHSPDWDTRNFSGGTLGKGRVGILATRFRGAGPKLEMAPPIWLYSDDGGQNWRARELELPKSAPFASFHGDIIRWPLSAGGHDELGFAAFSYNHERKAIDGIYTKDNGESWSWQTDICVSDGIIASWLTESWVSAVGPNGPWIMTARPIATGTKANLAVFVSNDLVQWDGPRDGGILLSGNAPALIIENGEAYIYTVARRGANRELPNSAGESLGNRLLVAHAGAAAVIAGTSDFSENGGWLEVAALPDHAVGYIFPRKIRRRWFAVFNCGETGSVGTSESKRSWLGLMTPHQPLIVDAPLLRTAMPVDNIIDNGDFSIWSRGTRFENIPSGHATADRWFVHHGNKDLVNVEQVEIAHPMGGPNTWFHKTCRPAADKSTIKTVQRNFDVSLGSDSRITLMLRAASATGTTLSCIKIIQNFGLGGSPSVETVLQKSIRLSSMPLFYSFSSALPPISGKVLGPGSCIEIVIEERSAGDGHPFDIILGDLALITSPVAGSVRKLAIDDTRRVCEKYFQRLKLIGTGAVMSMGYTTFASTYPRMVRTPILRLVSDMAPVSGILTIDPRNSLVLELARSRVQILAEAPPFEPLLEATLELDAEWRPGELEGHFLKERQDGAIWRRMDGATWVSQETVDTQGSAFTHTEEVDDSLSKFMNRARTQFELNALEKRLIDELLVGNEVSNDTLAVRQKLLDKLNGPTRSSGSM